MSDEARPRTAEERQAYAVGFAVAINTVDELGLEEAREILRAMVAVEPDLVGPPGAAR